MLSEWREKEVFWLKEPSVLLTEMKFIPKEDMTLEEQLNTVTRLIIVVFIVMLILKYKHALTFLMIALIIIIIYYYSQKRKRKHYALHGHSDLQSISGHSDLQSINGHSDLRTLCGQSNEKEDGPSEYMRFRVESGNNSGDNENPNESGSNERYEVNAGNESDDDAVEVGAERDDSDILDMESDTIVNGMINKKSPIDRGAPINKKSLVNKKSPLNKLSPIGKKSPGKKSPNGKSSPSGKKSPNGKTISKAKTPIKNNPRRPFPAIVPSSLEVHAARNTASFNRETDEETSDQESVDEEITDEEIVVSNHKRKSNPRRPNPVLVQPDLEIRSNRNHSNRYSPPTVSKIVVDDYGYILAGEIEHMHSTYIAMTGRSKEIINSSTNITNIDDTSYVTNTSYDNDPREYISTSVSAPVIPAESRRVIVRPNMSAGRSCRKFISKNSIVSPGPISGHSVGRAAHKHPNTWADANQPKPRMTASDLFFKRAADIEAKTKPIGRITSQDIYNSVF